jgi:hypothetical protein
MAREKKAKAPKKPGRAAQLIQTFRMTRQADPRITWFLLGTFLVAGAVAGVVLHFALGGWRH